MKRYLSEMCSRVKIIQKPRKTSGTASSAAGTAQGGTLNIMLETKVQSLDPQIATDGTSFEVIADYTDGLMQMDADGAPQKVAQVVKEQLETTLAGFT